MLPVAGVYFFNLPFLMTLYFDGWRGGHDLSRERLLHGRLQVGNMEGRMDLPGAGSCQAISVGADNLIDRQGVLAFVVKFLEGLAKLRFFVDSQTLSSIKNRRVGDREMYVCCACLACA